MRNSKSTAEKIAEQERRDYEEWRASEEAYERAGHAPKAGPRRKAIKRDDAVEVSEREREAEKHGLWSNTGRVDLSREFVFDDDMIKGLIPRIGVGLLTGTSGSYKTFNALRLCVAVSEEPEFAGHKIQRPGGSIYLGYEGHETIQSRLVAAFKDIGCGHNSPPIFVPENPMRFNQRNAFERLAYSIDDVKKELRGENDTLSLVVIDTAIAASLVADEMNPVQWQNAFTGLSDVAREMDLAIAVVAHAGKDATKGARGSSGIYAAADFELTFSAAYDRIKGETTGRLVSLTKNREGESKPIAAMLKREVVSGRTHNGYEKTTIVLDYDTSSEAIEKALEEQDAVLNKKPGRPKKEGDEPQSAKVDYKALIDKTSKYGRFIREAVEESLKSAGPECVTMENEEGDSVRMIKASDVKRLALFKAPSPDRTTIEGIRRAVDSLVKKNHFRVMGDYLEPIGFEG